MPLTLATRIGSDTVMKLERAARRRFAEARQLQKENEKLGAIYLYGYSIEIRLKCAYYRITGVGLHHDIRLPFPPNTQSPRTIAENQIRITYSPPHGSPVGHHLAGWARLLVDTRAINPAPGPFGAQFAQKLVGLVDNAALCWTVFLRYHDNKPYHEESTALFEAARWIQRNYMRLWSSSWQEQLKTEP